MAVALLDSDTVAAETARHRDVQRRVDGDLRFCILCRIKMYGIRQRITALTSTRDDIDFFAVYDDILAVSGIDARRITDAVLHLQLQGEGEFPKIETSQAGVGDGGKHIGLFVADLVRTDIDELVCHPIFRRTLRNRIDIVAARLPDSVRIRSGCLRRAADLCGRSEVDRCKRSRHMVGSEHCHVVKKSSGAA